VGKRDLTCVVVRLASARGRLLTKKQLAGELGRSTRRAELRTRAGLPVLPRRTPGEHARLDLQAVRAWLDGRSERACVPIDERVARLERHVTPLAAALAGERA
jgi:phage terminase Nu1 subunit (DNA packaging protein)